MAGAGGWFPLPPLILSPLLPLPPRDAADRLLPRFVSGLFPSLLLFREILFIVIFTPSASLGIISFLMYTGSSPHILYGDVPLSPTHGFITLAWRIPSTKRKSLVHLCTSSSVDSSKSRCPLESRCPLKSRCPQVKKLPLEGFAADQQAAMAATPAADALSVGRFEPRPTWFGRRTKWKQTEG
jgi:hypothetical protein